MRFGDAFNDPIAGYLSEPHTHPLGTGANLVLVSVPCSCFRPSCFFSPPASLGTGVGLAVYFTVFLM
jgi:GPH family glycoside/pentoside/hexuronide:cation symporter